MPSPSPFKKNRFKPLYLLLVPLFVGYIRNAYPETFGITSAALPPTYRMTSDYCTEAFRKLLIHLAKRQKPDPDGKSRYREISGWFEFIDLVRKPVCHQMKNAPEQLISWKMRYPDHPVIHYFPEIFARNSPAQNSIGLLLPLSGPRKKQAQLIARGALEVAKQQNTPVQLFDTHNKNAKQILEETRQHNLSCLIGPLLKNQVAEMAKTEHQRPMLVLNYLPKQSPPPYLFQIALTPEDEARSLAELLIQHNHERGIILYPENSAWGERVASTVMQTFIENGGDWAGSHRYNTHANDFSKPLKNLMGIQDSLNRAKKIEQLLNRHTVHTPRRRQDFQFIVIIGKQKNLRTLYPQLRFWHAENVPVYMISSDVENLSRYRENDLDSIQLMVPAWYEKHPENRISNHSLKLLGSSAVNIALGSHCLNPAYLPALNRINNVWRFDPGTGKIHYRSRAALIRKNKLIKK